MTATPRLNEKVAIVTGASSGIGTATAQALGAEGAAVVLAARRVDRLTELEGEMRAKGFRVLAVHTDVTDRDEVEAMVAVTLETFGQVDILVNNAGVMPLSPIEECRVDDWIHMVDVNVKGVLFGVGAVLPHMLERESGHIVNVGSVAGRRALPMGSVYSATKFAVRALTAGMQLELSASRGIRVTDVQPGMVATELTEHIPDRELRDAFAERTAGWRPLEAEDVAGAVIYAVTAPDRVNVNEILIRPTDQPT
jgi:NADP-dependent 3-hydroxy acid dehydrogenase YdfG